MEDDYYMYDDIDYDLRSQNVFEYCIKPTLEQSFIFISQIFIANFLFNISTTIIKHIGKNNSVFYYHIISVILGLLLLFLQGSVIYSETSLYLFTLINLSYILLKYTVKNEKYGLKFIIALIYIAFLIKSELLSSNYSEWIEMRSIAMICIMKMFSLLSDCIKHKKTPSIIEYMGYMLCPGNILIGPWITYNEYLAGFYQKSKMNLLWMLAVVKCVFISFCMVCVSNCAISFFLEDTENIYIRYYKEALIFRTSHYFISYVASSGMVTGGFTDNKSSHIPSYSITNPIEIEYPRSLATVVVNWNIPMHKFLKIYVFQDLKKLGTFMSVFITFAISSMLHGLNVEVTVVLLSLGVFSYIEAKSRNGLSKIINACVQSRKCKSCSHVFKYFSVKTGLINFLCTLITVLYLAYIGSLMENIDTRSSVDSIINAIIIKWSKVDYIGHIVLFASLLFALF